MKPRYLVRSADIPSYQPANHHHTSNQRLIGPETVPRMDGKVQLESKADMKKRGLRSPNKGDALALSSAYPVRVDLARKASYRRALAARHAAGEERRNDETDLPHVGAGGA